MYGLPTINDGSVSSVVFQFGWFVVSGAPIGKKILIKFYLKKGLN